MGSLDDNDDNQTFGFTHRIMLAAIGSLVGVVMLIVLLHLYARYLLKHQERRRRAEFYGSRTNQITPVDEIHVVEPPKSKLDPLIIASLPMFTYKATVETSRVDQNNDPTECPV
ncbi:hypothetical protein HRI_003016100 [Hibiscus trionum]|uniref:Uncharacterized protein n=1 Tax=Hibiscus trionum TaxID=183268 RepID=A0A9W7M9R2_HIBTR|nr:hypothetical protein HRI_003016100 [Hibiscus trionum]